MPDGLSLLDRRLPPENTQAEQALLGALLANNKAYGRVSDFLAPEHFGAPEHGRIFAAIQRRIERGQLADGVTLKAEFEHSGVLDGVGGTPYLAQLLAAMVGIINAGDYGRAIHDAWIRRQLIDLGESVVNRAFGSEGELDGHQQIEAAQVAIERLAGGADPGIGTGTTVAAAMAAAIAEGEAARREGGTLNGPAVTRSRDRSAPAGKPDRRGREACHGEDRARAQYCG